MHQDRGQTIRKATLLKLAYLTFVLHNLRFERLLTPMVYDRRGEVEEGRVANWSSNWMGKRHLVREGFEPVLPPDRIQNRYGQPAGTEPSASQPRLARRLGRRLRSLGKCVGGADHAHRFQSGSWVTCPGCRDRGRHNVRYFAGKRARFATGSGLATLRPGFGS
jgi:hypothetical protein